MGCWICQNPTSTHTQTHTLSHTHTHCCTTRDTVAAFSKGKDKYNTVSGSSAVRYANTQEQQQNEIHTPTSVQSRATQEGGGSASRGDQVSVQSGLASTPQRREEEVCSRRRGRELLTVGNNPVHLIIGCEALWTWSNKPCLMAIFCKDLKCDVLSQVSDILRATQHKLGRNKNRTLL